MLDHYTFRISGGARGVDGVSEVLRRDWKVSVLFVLIRDALQLIVNAKDSSVAPRNIFHEMSLG